MRLLERFDRATQLHHLAESTRLCYRNWMISYLRFHCDGGRWPHPRDLGAAEVGRYLTHLAADRHLSASSQNQATCAIVFLYKQVLADEVSPEHLGRFAVFRCARPVTVPPC